MRFSAEIWRRSEQNQAFGNFSNVDIIIITCRRERVKEAKTWRITVAGPTGHSRCLPQCRRSRAVTYSEAPTYTYDVVSTLHDPCHRHHWRRRRRKEHPRWGPPVWMKGLRLSLRWLKTTRSTQQQHHSSTGYTPMSRRGDVTLPGARSGGVPPPCERRERELSGRPPRQSGSNWYYTILSYIY